MAVLPLEGLGEVLIVVQTFSSHQSFPGSLIYREAALFLTDPVERKLDNLSVVNRLAGTDWEDVEIEKEKLEFVRVIKSFLNLNSDKKDQYLQLCEGQPNRRTDVAIRAAIKTFSESEHLPYNLFRRVCYIFRVNAFNNGIFLTLSRLNHSCLPSTEIFWNVETRTQDLVAIQDINIGEELCHNYLQSSWSFTDRRSDLREKWNFTCTCSSCYQGLDLHIMEMVEEVNLNFRSHSGSVERLINILINLKDLRLIRISKVLRVLDRVYLQFSIDGLLSTTFCDIVESVVAVGVQYSHILVGPDGSLTARWLYRKQHPLLSAFNCLFKEMFVFLVRLLTFVILFHNYWENIVWQYIVLLLCSLLYSKL